MRASEPAPRAQPAGNHQLLTPPAAGFALLLAALWGGNPTAIKAGLDDAGPLRLAGYRFIAGGLVTIAWAVYTKQSMLPARSEFRALIGLGVLFIAQIAFMNFGQDHTTAAHGVVINTTFPLWTGVIAHFFVPGDRLSAGRTVGTLIAYGGVVAIFAPAAMPTTQSAAPTPRSRRASAPPMGRSSATCSWLDRRRSSALVSSTRRSRRSPSRCRSCS